MTDALKDIHYFTTSLASVFTLFSAWRTARMTYHIQQKRSTIRRIQNSEVISVDQLNKRGLKVNEVVIVRGNVGTKDGKQVEKNLAWGKKQKIAIDLKFTEAIYSNDSFKKQNYILNMKDVLKTCIIQGTTKVTLFSEDNNKQKRTILLKNFDQKDYSRVLQVLNWEQKKRSLSLVQHINVILLGILRALIMIGSQGKDGQYLRGIEIGKREVEAGLKVGASISVLGTISLTLDGQFVLDPQRIFKDRLSQISNLNDQIQSIIHKRNIWLLGSVLGSIYLGRRAFKYCKQHKIKIPFIGEL